jgi:tripartite-type tricarboxylate transporter receptor subunit TctC
MKRVSGVSALLGVSAFLVAFGIGPASAQTMPQGPVKLVVGFAAGGSNDIVARIIAKKAAEMLGETIIVQNQPGANGAIAAEAIARAKPDGLSLLIASPSVLTIAPNLTPNLPYSPLRDFVGIGTVAVNTQVIAVNPDVKAQDMKEFMNLTKSSDLTMGAAGIGGLSHLTIELLKLSTGGKLTLVPFRGGAPATNDVVAGHIDGIVMDLPPLKPFIESGRLRALAITSRTRSTFLPNVPTAIESGLGDMEAVNWFAILAPKGTPPEIADTLHAVFTKAAQDPAVVETLAKSGIEPMTQNSRAEFDTFLQAELTRWNKVVQTAKIVSKTE